MTKRLMAWAGFGRQTGWCLLSCLILVCPLFVGQVQASDLALADLPPCELSAPGMDSGVSIGLAQPYASPAVVAFAVRQTLTSAQFRVCSEAWSEVVPRWLPWAHHLERVYGFAAFVLSLVLVVGVLYAVTPRRWWHRTTLLGVLAIAFLTWLTGVLVLAGFHWLGGQRLFYATALSLRLPQQAHAEWFDVAGARELEALLVEHRLLPTVVLPVEPVVPKLTVTGASDAGGQSAEPDGDYRVFHRLNLRVASGVHSNRLTVLERGETVHYDGARDGDWWRIRSSSGLVGWTSSLWLRRPAEIPGA